MELDATIEAYHQTVVDIVRGDAGPLQAMWSHGDDVTLANPWGPARKGWNDVAEGMALAASQFSDGAARTHEELTRFVTDDLAALVVNERWEAKVSGRSEITPFDLRVTTVFRVEDGDWKVVHRHADPITVPNPDGPIRS